VRPAGRSLVRLARFGCMRAMMDHLWMRFGDQPG
jgi:hypothetical protein